MRLRQGLERKAGSLSGWIDSENLPIVILRGKQYIVTDKRKRNGLINLCATMTVAVKRRQNNTKMQTIIQSIVKYKSSSSLLLWDKDS